MDEIFPGDLHAGLTQLVLLVDSFDLGEGITLSRTYAHLMAHFMLAFAQPPPGSHHPGPWKAARHGFAFDITTDLHIPERHQDRIGIARTIVFLIRLYINPAVTIPILSNHPFADLKNLPDKEAITIPLEIWPRHFPLSAEHGDAGDEQIEGVKRRWRAMHRLMNDSPEFALAAAAIESGQFIQNSALTLVSLWGALEALFSPSTTELKFRVSALIAAFLEPPGNSRLSLQKNIAKLYDKRSSAAHGKPQYEENDLLDTFNLLRRVLMDIIDNGKVPTKDELEARLFGCLP